MTRNRATEKSIAQAKKRGKRLLRLYRSGLNLQQIANKFKITRSRAQQIVVKALRNEIKGGILRRSYPNPENKTIKELVADEIEQIRETRAKSDILEKIDEKEEKGITPEKFTSETRYAKELGVRLDLLRLIAPDIIEVIRRNKTKGTGGKKWSRFYLQCLECGTTSIKHRSLGLCVNCYYKSENFKNMQKTSWLRHHEHWRIRQKEYLKDYYRRPEVKERLKKWNKKLYDKKYFGGNREEVIERDGYKCSRCGIEREKNLNEYGKDLSVLHINGRGDDNSLDNLATFCRSCLMIKLLERRSFNYKKA